MIKKIVFSLIFLCMLIAIPLALLGIRHVSVGGAFLSFLRGCSMELNQYKVAIPNIPNVPTPQETGGWWDVLGVLVSIANGVIGICNFAINFMNTIVQLLQFVFIIIRRLITLKDTLAANPTSSYIPPVV